MKPYYEVRENARVPHMGRLVNGSKKILRTYDREEALALYEEDEVNRWVEEFFYDGECWIVDVIAN